MYTIIAENDESQWSDDTGVLYHYPKRYAKYLLPETNLIYYKGKLTDKKYSSKRLSDEPHYFGVAKVGKVYLDKDSSKGDLFAVIEDFRMFSSPVLARTNSGYLENIPENRKTNYWRDGVRPINKDVYEKIIGSDASFMISEPTQAYDAKTESPENEFESLQEGSKEIRFVTTYERDQKLRRQAVAIHGTICVACGFNFEKFYGDYAKGFIHIHHVEPVSAFGGPKMVDPETDLVPLCANCHAVVHKRKEKTLSISELIKLIESQSNKAFN